MDYTITDKQIHEAVNHAIRKILLEYGRINANEYLWRACHDNKYEEGYNGF
jgi:hypothetical protein